MSARSLQEFVATVMTFAQIFEEVIGAFQLIVLMGTCEILTEISEYFGKHSDSETLCFSIKPAVARESACCATTMTTTVSANRLRIPTISSQWFQI